MGRGDIVSPSKPLSDQENERSRAPEAVDTASAPGRQHPLNLGSRDGGRATLRLTPFVREVLLSDPPPPPQIAVVIATCDRVGLLRDRALASVLAQTRPPDRLVVVDDSDEQGRAEVRAVVGGLGLPGCRITYLENSRSPGASGGWNTAIDYLFGEVPDPASLFVAVLDDDDAWAPTYLELCLKAARERQLDMVAADLRRVEGVEGEPLVNAAPERLSASDFLTGNPGVQGSNLFIRLSLLLAAGGFDEALRSTTDRDLCIRLADLGRVRYGRLPAPLVDHHADPDRPRLSTRGSSAKLDGLTAFWRKYVGRMSSQQRRAFSERASTLFGWRPPADPLVTESASTAAAPKAALVVGLVARNDRPGELLAAIRQLTSCRDDDLVGLDVVLVESGIPRGNPSLLDMAAEALRDAGAGCFRFPLERLASDAEALRLSEPDAVSGSLPSQTLHVLLKTYCSRVAEARTGTEVWLADCPSEPRASASGAGVRDQLRSLGAVRVDLAEGPPFARTVPQDRVSSIDHWVEQERVATAAHRVRKRFSLDRLRVLGRGSEAVVFTDGRTVYKCIDYWKTRMPREQLEFLRAQVGRWADVPGLYTLREVAEDGPWAVLTYDYEQSTPYQGGHEEDLVRLLSGCTAAGIVCNNVHPKNLVVTSNGVKLIDYGSDIRPWSPLGFEHMARRAFLACRHAAHPDLARIMRRALTDARLPELDGYDQFRAVVAEHTSQPPGHHSPVQASEALPPHDPFVLYVGVITSDPSILRPLLDGLASLRHCPSVQRLAVLVLDNASPEAALERAIEHGRRQGLSVAVVGRHQQRRDAELGAFGSAFMALSDDQVGIAQARTMLQRYVGALMEQEDGSFGWILDDDMRVDARAHAYLPWLPAFRERGVDALIGAYEGSSPNPPLNGLRVHLVDLFHNLAWLGQLPPDLVLPDRTAENAALRRRYPDYYYDLSRKHTGHLEVPFWLEPAFPGETVAEARARLVAGALGILSGEPLTRPIVATVPENPLVAARDSVNRGGCTFILNRQALTLTPNAIPLVEGREARRSDMVWAIVNRHYRRMTIKSVGFPVHHVGRVTDAPSLNVEKVQGEIVGSTLYAGLTEFLEANPHNELGFSPEEVAEVHALAEKHLDQRTRSLEQSLRRIAGLRDAIRGLVPSGELGDLLGTLDQWFAEGQVDRLISGIRSCPRDGVQGFLDSLRAVADDYASRTVDTDFIAAQLGLGAASAAGGAGS